EEGRSAVDSWNAGRARGVARELMQRYPESPFVLSVAAQADFISGRYAACREKLDRIEELGGEPPEKLQHITGELEDLHESFQTVESDQFTISYARPVDGILAEYAPEVLERSLSVLSDYLNWRPEENKIRVEIYPTLSSFSTATTLSTEEIRTSGAVAICKFNRIMIASPRLYMQGYRWADTLSHELTHYILIRKTGHDIPVWLHEGIAKSTETLWREGHSSTRLTPMQSTLLAQAREEDRFIPFDDMAISLVKLDSREEVALAYAEVVSFIHYLKDSYGVDSLSDVIGYIEEGKSVKAALRETGGAETSDMYEQWEKWVSNVSLDPIPGLRVLPRKIAEGEDNTARDERMMGGVEEEAQRYVRLGDMLRDESRPNAAAIEYRKAVGQAETISPELRVELARVLLKSDQVGAAEATLEEVAEYYPDFLPLYLVRARLRRREGDEEGAIEDLRTVVSINPFDPRPHRMLVKLYQRIGETDKVEREQRVLDKIDGWLE
ncbi:MAG: peptidase MA family metallohydrolase, partial [Planctomycetota bacterium]